uniref:Putative deddh 3'-5' exonuclease domain of three prime repair exonuclease n=1 Tax=Ixodes ricinus TaxID=34613 RepID=V5HZ96_IXORI
MPKHKVNITEIALVAIERTNFKEGLRYVHKLTFCVKPRNAIMEDASRITGLDNEQLEGCPTFEKVAPLVERFLQVLPQPVCLLAYNGNGFDFPLLHAELQRCGVNFGPFLCCDAMPIIRQLLCDPALLERLELAALEELTPDFWEAFDECDVNDPALRLSPTEVTPTKSRTVPINAAPQKRHAPVRDSPPDKSARKSLFSTKESVAKRAPAQNGAQNGARQSFTLESVYKRLFGRPVRSAHNAEADCVALAEICCRLREPLLEYVDANCRSVVQVAPMW